MNHGSKFYYCILKLFLAEIWNMSAVSVLLTFHGFVWEKKLFADECHFYFGLV